MERASAEFTSGDIAAAEKSLAPAPPAEAPKEPTATADAGTTAPPAVPEPKKDDFKPVPWERHEVILNNTRREYEGKLSGLSWAERLKREDVEEALALRDLAKRDPDKLVQQYAKPKVGEAPQADARDEKGEAFYSPQQAAALARYEAKQAVDALRAELGERLSPIESERMQRDRDDANWKRIEEASAWPGFVDRVDDVTKAIADANAKGQTLSLHDAYIRIVVPTLAETNATREADLKKQWLADLNNTDTVVRKDDVNPARVAAGSRKADKDKPFREIIEEEFEKARRA